jgi:hypothetical protein
MKTNWKHLFGWHWFDRSWYQYLFAKFDDPGWCPWYEHLWCRMNGHPAGQIYFNPGGYEPDYRCKECGDEI